MLFGCAKPIHSELETILRLMTYWIYKDSSLKGSKTKFVSFMISRLINTSQVLKHSRSFECHFNANYLLFYEA